MGISHFSPICHLCPGNTALIYHHGKLLALQEADKPCKLSPFVFTSEKNKIRGGGGGGGWFFSAFHWSDSLIGRCVYISPSAYKLSIYISGLLYWL